MKKEFLKLIATGKLEDAIKQLLEVLENSDQEDLYYKMIQFSARYHRNNDEKNMGTILESNYNLELNRITNGINDLILKEFEDPKGDTDGNPQGVVNPNAESDNNGSSKKSVFISYSHKESVYAIKMKETLEQNDIDVIIDAEDNVAGSEIESFIEESINKSSNTVSIISMNSLLSAWVSIEMIKTIKSENISNKNFIAAFIDGEFFNRTYPDTALDKIDIEIEEIKALIKTRLDKNRNIDELESELSRYQDLKHYFPKIIKRLNDSLTVDIRDDKFDDGMKAIIDALK